MMIFRRFLMIVSLFLASFTHLYGVKKPTLYVTNSNFQVSAPTINSSLSVYNLSVDPLTPEIVTTVTTGARGAGAVLVNPQETALYVLNRDSNRISVFDISNDPQNPLLQSSLIGTTTGPISMAIDLTGRALYVGHSNSFIRVYDISNPLSPTLVSSFSVGSSNNQVVVDPRGTYLYVGQGSTDTVRTYDITNPLAPVSVGIPVSTGFTTTNALVNMITTSQGNVLYTADSAAIATDDYISVFNILTTPVVPNLTTTSQVNFVNTFGLAIDDTGQVLYASNTGSDNFSVFNISNPLNPDVPSSVALDATSAPRGLKVHPTANVLYVANSGTSNMAIFDLTNPLVPAPAVQPTVEVPGVTVSSTTLVSKPEQIAILVHADPLPPADVRVMVKRSCRASQNGAAAGLVWNPSPSLTTIVAYRIYRNGKLIAEVSSADRTFVDCGICGDNSYQMSSVDDQGLESPLANAQFIQC